MTSTAFVSTKNSTIVRSNTVANTVAGVDPHVAARSFGEPPAPRAPRVPEVPGAITQRSTLRVGANDLAVYRWQAERGSGPTVLLAHGFGGSAAQLTSFVPELLAAGSSVVAFDQPAHGFSPGRYAHLVAFSRNVTAVARAFDAHTVIAHSLGATATLVAHARGLTLERAVLIAPPGNVEHFAAVYADAIGLPRERVPAMLAEVEREFGFPLALLDVRSVLSLASDIAPADILVMHDPADAEVPYLHGRQLVDHWPNARLETVTGVGHRRVLRDAAVVHTAVEHVTRKH